MLKGTNKVRKKVLKNNNFQNKKKKILKKYLNTKEDKKSKNPNLGNLSFGVDFY